MGKALLDSESVNIVRNRILAIKANNTWEQAAKRIGVSRGYLYRVASGTRPASNKLLAKLGLPPHTVAVTPCAKCGAVHVTKRCTDKAQPTKYPPHPVMRVGRVRRLVNNWPWCNS